MDNNVVEWGLHMIDESILRSSTPRLHATYFYTAPRSMIYIH